MDSNSARGRWTLAATILGSSMAFIDGSALNVALPALQKDLQATGTDLLWVVNGYLLLLASLILIGGSLGDRLGRNQVFRAGIIIFSVSSFVCGISPSIGLLIAARVVQGIGGALMVPGSLAIISATFQGDQKGQAIGIWSAAGTITTIAGPLLGGFLAGHGLWRGVFFINIPLAALALISLTHVEESRDESASPNLDYAGTALVVIGLAGLTYGALNLSQGGGTPSVVGLGVGIVALIAFVLVEWRSSHPMVNLSLFRSRTFSGTNLMTALLYGALSGALFFFPLNLIQVQGYDEQIAGLVFLPFSLLLAGFSTLAGRLMARYGPRILLTIGPGIVAVGFVLLALPGVTGGVQDFWTTYFPGIVAMGIGMGLTVAPLTTSVMGSVAPHHAGVASGINNAVTRSAQVLATAILGAIALSAFSAALLNHVAPLQLPTQAVQSLQQNAVNFGNTAIPSSLDTGTQAQVRQAIQLAFVDAFREVTFIAAGLALLSAIVSFILVSPKLKIEEDT